ncbi:hypothetical protein ACP275_08G034300 [Erythranthe tilingii]
MSSASPSQKPDVTLSLNLSPPSPSPNDGLKPQERSVELIQLLLTCANHASSGNLRHADTCLCRISELASVSGDSMQRLAARFASALAARLVKRWPGLYKALNNGGLGLVSFDMDRARSVFLRSFSFLSFAYAIINRTLIQAMSGEQVIHIIDLGWGDPKLWVPFIRGVANGPDGPPRLKFTFVGMSKESQERLQGRLVKEAKTLNIMQIEFNIVNAKLRELTLDMLKVNSGEAIALTSILGLHALLAEDDRVDARFGLHNNNNKKINQVKECKRMAEFLEMVRSIGPKVVLLVEQESDHNSTRLADRFVEGLHYYSALFDWIDLKFGGFSCTDRTRLEEMFGQEIEDIVAGEGLEREERHERYVKWAFRFTKAGFRPVRLWYETMDEAREMVEGCRLGGFKVVSQKGSLMICWHERPIYAVSAWTCFSS